MSQKIHVMSGMQVLKFPLGRWHTRGDYLFIVDDDGNVQAQFASDGWSGVWIQEEEIEDIDES